MALFCAGLPAVAFAACAPKLATAASAKAGGGGGIRTHGGLHHAGFQDRFFRPLRHPSEKIMIGNEVDVIRLGVECLRPHAGRVVRLQEL